EPAPQVLVLLLLRDAGIARGHRARQELALLPTLPAGREPALHAAGARALRGRMVPTGGGRRDDQLLPRLGEAVPKGRPRRAPTDLSADPGHLGRARFLSRLRARRARSRRRAQPRPRRAPP